MVLTKVYNAWAKKSIEKLRLVELKIDTQLKAEAE